LDVGILRVTMMPPLPDAVAGLRGLGCRHFEGDDDAASARRRGREGRSAPPEHHGLWRAGAGCGARRRGAEARALAMCEDPPRARGEDEGDGVQQMSFRGPRTEAGVGTSTRDTTRVCFHGDVFFGVSLAQRKAVQSAQCSGSPWQQYRPRDSPN